MRCPWPPPAPPSAALRRTDAQAAQLQGRVLAPHAGARPRHHRGQRVMCLARRSRWGPSRLPCRLGPASGPGQAPRDGLSCSWHSLHTRLYLQLQVQLQCSKASRLIKCLRKRKVPLRVAAPDKGSQALSDAGTTGVQKELQYQRKEIVPVQGPLLQRKRPQEVQQSGEAALSKLRLGTNFCFYLVATRSASNKTTTYTVTAASKPAAQLACIAGVCR